VSISKKLLHQIESVASSVGGDGQLFLKVLYKDSKAVNVQHSYSSTQYLSRLEASPEDPITSAVAEKFVTAHAGVAAKKGRHIVDPLGILNGQNKGAQGSNRRASSGSASSRTSTTKKSRV
jgi:hypothetical protein